MLLNIASMPMKAYVSEHPPWAAQPPPPTYANDSDFNIKTLAHMQAAYNVSTLPATALFFDDSARNTQVMRHVLVMNHRPILVDDCRDRFLVGLPSVLFYGAGIRNVLCAFAAANHSSPSDGTWDRRGACMYITYFSMAIGHQCVWLRAGNELDGSNTSSHDTYTLVAAHKVYTYSALHSLKFVYRIGISLLTLHLIFRYNGVKSQAMFTVLQWAHPDKNSLAPEVGGSVYSIFRRNARYKRSPTISFRSADCFVYCYKDNVLVERLRLSLLESLDRNEPTPSLAVLNAPTTSKYTLHRLLDQFPPVIARAREPSHWCI
ncbi:hypothetical protein SDRG_03874 [Saprolegnia diclina VS20]|uniref:Uncharacterized protein n=1 Tax=Saprolegnia diclina (strain VS20) TaxID=1156394 RepID=T0QW67_SAPDV|nr:hypothetical protein SDRG_03874 [Saprolegnia diclina VS20]EQC38916.1 hypothetical protein SDRG_03874 [Saprolegnia diclina VS20]|eukprot:XP_008607740.1 hypothetical protein SDRG_03874 [Saprolegnia diclina VS20]